MYVCATSAAKSSDDVLHGIEASSDHDRDGAELLKLCLNEELVSSARRGALYARHSCDCNCIWISLVRDGRSLAQLRVRAIRHAENTHDERLHRRRVSPPTEVVV